MGYDYSILVDFDHPFDLEVDRSSLVSAVVLFLKQEAVFHIVSLHPGV